MDFRLNNYIIPGPLKPLGNQVRAPAASACARALAVGVPAAPMRARERQGVTRWTRVHVQTPHRS
jgi:hypothetical protein